MRLSQLGISQANTFRMICVRLEEVQKKSHYFPHFTAPRHTLRSIFVLWPFSNKSVRWIRMGQTKMAFETVCQQNMPSETSSQGTERPLWILTRAFHLNRCRVTQVVDISAQSAPGPKWENNVLWIVGITSSKVVMTAARFSKFNQYIYHSIDQSGFRGTLSQSIRNAEIVLTSFPSRIDKNILEKFCFFVLENHCE